MHDWQLLREYQETGSQVAFARLVERYANLVYSTCLREVRDPHLAEDAMQAVFLILARKAKGMREGTILAGWLFQTARFASKNALQQEARRRRHQETVTEAIARDMKQRAGDVAWQQLEPLLHDALATLRPADRDAVLLRFFDDKSLKDVGASLGISEDAARMRVARALEKLRHYFSRRGFAISTVLLAAALAAHSVQAAPAHCVAAAIQSTSTALAGGSVGATAGSSSWSLSQQIARQLMIAKLKVVTIIVAGSVAAGTGAVHYARSAGARSHRHPPFAAALVPRAHASEISAGPSPHAAPPRVWRRQEWTHRATVPTLQLASAVTAPRRQEFTPHIVQPMSTHQAIRTGNIRRSKTMQSYKHTSLKPRLVKLALTTIAPLAASVAPIMAQPQASTPPAQTGDAKAAQPERKGDAAVARKGDGKKADVRRRVDNGIISAVDLAANALKIQSQKKDRGGGDTMDVQLLPATEYQQEEQGVAATDLKVGDLVSVLPRKGEGRDGNRGVAPVAVLRVDGEAKVTSTAPLTLQVGEYATVTITQPDQVVLSRYSTIKATDLAAGQTITLDASEGADHNLSASSIVVHINLKPAKAARPQPVGRDAGKQ